MTREEHLIYSRLSRRRFMGATAAGTFSALVGREPGLVRRQTKKPPSADAIIEASRALKAHPIPA